MQNYTKNGLFFILIGLLIGLIGSIVSGIYALVSSLDTITDVAGYLGVAMFGVIGGILMFVGAILLIIGRKEFGPKHQKFIIYAIIIFIIGIVVSSVVGGISVFLSISSSISEGTSFNPSGISTFIFIAAVIGSITGGIAYILALYELEDKKGRLVLYTAFIISIVIAALIGMSTADLMTDIYSNIGSDPSSYNLTSAFSMQSPISKYTILGAVSNAFWAFAVYLPYKRIKEEELVPQSMEVFGSQQKPPERICPNCNKAIPNDANICPYCGKSFESYL